MKKIQKIMKIILVTTLFCNGSVAQEEAKKEEFNPSGKAHGKIFFNYHYDMTKDVNKTSVFEIKRSYFGYKYAFSEKISAMITFNVGSVGAGNAYTAYLKIAQLDWQVCSPLKLSFGQIGLKQYNDQEKFWGHRYVYKSCQDEHQFGTSADAGINANIKLHKTAQVNISMLNGEGYKATQDDFGLHKIAANLVLTPVKGLLLKGYYDMKPSKYETIVDTLGNTEVRDSSVISVICAFVGYNYKDKFRIGFEYNLLSGGKKYSSYAEDHSLSGISAYVTYIINKKFEVFGRFDQLSSNTLNGTTDPWNYSKDGSLIITGFQFHPVKGVKVALNYQGWTYDNSDLNINPKVYVNFEYKF